MNLKNIILILHFVKTLQFFRFPKLTFNIVLFTNISSEFHHFSNASAHQQRLISRWFIFILPGRSRERSTTQNFRIPFWWCNFSSFCFMRRALLLSLALPQCQFFTLFLFFVDGKKYQFMKCLVHNNHHKSIATISTACTNTHRNQEERSVYK